VGWETSGHPWAHRRRSSTTTARSAPARSMPPSRWTSGSAETATTSTSPSPACSSSSCGKPWSRASPERRRQPLAARAPGPRPTTEAHRAAGLCGSLWAAPTHRPDMAPLGAAIFLVTYVLISARRLEWLGFDRPAAALLGAVSCVVLGVLSPEEALAAVDGATLLLLFGVMGMGAFLAVDGAFEAAEGWLLSAAGSPARLLGFVVWGAGIGGALITNDAVCLLAAPLVVRLVVAHNLPSLPFLLALATAANTGSVATLVGNPQN